MNKSLPGCRGWFCGKDRKSDPTEIPMRSAKMTRGRSGGLIPRPAPKWSGQQTGSLQFDLGLVGSVAKLLHPANVDLPHPLFGDAKVLADLLQGHLGVPVEAVPHPDHLAGSRVESLK